jgi:hypothetical protein
MCPSALARWVFPTPTRAHDQDVVSFGNEPQRAQFGPQLAIEAHRCVVIPRFERHGRIETRSATAVAVSDAFAPGDLVGEHDL